MSDKILVTVYDLDNKPHQMTPINARDMLSHVGWTMSPIDRKIVAETEAAQQIADIPAFITNANSSPLEHELNGMSKAEMIALASERYALKIDGRRSEQDVIKLILDAASQVADPVDDEDQTDDDQDTDDDEQFDEDQENNGE